MQHEVPFGDHALYRTKRGVTALLRSVVLFAGLHNSIRQVHNTTANTRLGGCPDYSRSDFHAVSYIMMKCLGHKQKAYL